MSNQTIQVVLDLPYNQTFKHGQHITVPATIRPGTKLEKTVPLGIWIDEHGLLEVTIPHNMLHDEPIMEHTLGKCKVSDMGEMPKGSS